jgi:predicted enzyme related to lactoylglutathione lyase
VGPGDAHDPAGGAEGETGVIGGDIYKRDKPQVPTVVVTVDSIEDALDAILKAGGTRLGEIESLGDVGRYAYFTDPEGNRIGLWDEKRA